MGTVTHLKQTEMGQNDPEQAQKQDCGSKIKSQGDVSVERILRAIRLDQKRNGIPRKSAIRRNMLRCENESYGTTCW